MPDLLVVFIALCLLELNCPAQVYSVNGHRVWWSISVSTNETVLFTDRSGARALVQFTSFGLREASYRWRYDGAGTNNTVGAGKLVESYEHIEKDGTLHWNAKPKADHDPIIKAGPVRIEWSYGSQTNGWVIYHAGEKVELLDSRAFDE